MGVGGNGPQFSSGIPNKHIRRKQDFQAPVQNREGRNPAPWPLEPRRALCGKAPGWRWASPAPGSRGEKGNPADEERRRGRGPSWLRGTESAYQARISSLIPGLGSFLGEGNGNPFQYSCLGNPMDRGA